MSNLETILATIESSQLVSPDVLDELRRRLEQSPQAADLRSAVRWLVQKEHMTSDQGRRLLAGKQPAPAASADDEMKLAPMDDEPPKAAARPAPSPPAAARPAARQAAPPPPDDDDLELFPVDEPPAAAAPRRPQPQRAPAANEIDEDLELFPLDEPQATSPPPKRPAAPTAGKPPSATPSRWAGTPKVPSPKTAPPPAAAPPAAAPAAARPRQPRPAATARPAPAQAAPVQDLFVEPALVQEGSWSNDEETFAQDDRQMRAVRHERNIWDSPLLLIGGGSLLAMLLTGGALYWALNRGSADQSYELADQDYKAGSYTQAIAKFDAYLESYPDDSRASLARVNRGMAKMRQAVDGARDWRKALAAAKEILAEIAVEKDFKDARDELAALLPKIADGLATQAREKLDPSLVESAHETEKLVAKYVPKELTPHQKMADIGASLALTERMLGRDSALETTLKEIAKAIAEGTPQVAYAQRKQLLKTYPDLLSNERLQEAVASLSEAVREQVKYIAQAQPADADDGKSPVEADVVLANHAGREAPGMAGEVAYALAGGAAYGLEAGTGKVLWRRFVGFDAGFAPQPITADPGSDVLLVDAVRHEVVRIGGAAGELRWRHKIGEPFDARPAVSRGKVWVATRSGRLVIVDLETGASSGYLQLPQGLRVGPAFDANGRLLYQLGENSNLYVISIETNECREVLYLGHEPESIRVAPLAVSPYLFVAENSGMSDAALHVLLTDGEGLSVRPAQASVQLPGHVLTPPVSAGRTLVVASDRGAMLSFEINAPEPGPPLTKVAEKPADDQPPLVRYCLLKDAQLWVAGGGLTKFDIQQARGRLEPKWIQNEGDVFLGAPTVRGDVLFHSRRKPNSPEVLVSAVKAGDGVGYWEAQLASPPAGAPTTSQTQGAMTIVNAAGSLFEAPAPAKTGGSVQDKAVSTIAVDGPFPEGVDAAVLADGGLALARGAGDKRALIADGAGALHWLALPDPLGAPPIGFGKGLLAPGQLGQVFVLDPATGQNLMAPFQPRLTGGEAFAWSAPVRLGDEEILLADGRATLYRLGVAAKPQPNLVALATAELPGPVTAPLVALA
ncbi:MAG TPA: PQQ-binding-like beta-propeller repeat protein, partial [Pirellulales bacterium]|nr:PQQ-binding-like beta-propeller repeat protein [Pirellulales bacterium]